MSHLCKSALALALLLGGCSRASAPPPASDASAPPPAPAPPAPPPSSAPSLASAQPPVAAPSAASEPAPLASGSASSPWTTPSACTDSSADARARATCEAKEEFRAFVAAHQSCTTAADCAIVTGSCPFGCFVPVAKASRAETLSKLDTLGDRLDKAGNRCVYRCMSPPTEACVAGRCSAAPAP